MAAFIGTYGNYRVYSTTTTESGWPESDATTTQGAICVEIADTTAISRGLTEAAEAVRRFEREVAELEVIPEPPPPWLGFRPAKLPARAFARRPCSTRRRRRTETARRQKVVKPP